MCRNRCEICRKKLSTYQRLIWHYVSDHSKFQLAREILKLSISNIMPKSLGKRRKLVTSNPCLQSGKIETLFSNDSVQILYQNNDIIIRDDKSTIDMEFSFDEISDDSREVCITEPKFDKQFIVNKQDKLNNNKIAKKRLESVTVTTIENATNPASSSSTSSEDSPKTFSFKQRIKRKRDTRDKGRHYKVNITRSKNCGFLDETSGKYFECHCKGTTEDPFESTKMKSESDTESASETGKMSYFNDAKVFCRNCGNDYMEESLLSQHAKVHENQCRVCNEIFQTEGAYKIHQSHTFLVFVCHICSYEFPAKHFLEKHLEAHLEHSIFESVIDMEQDYNRKQYTMPSISYERCISSIITYLEKTDGPKYTSSTSGMSSVNCAICFTEMSRYDFHTHMQNVHRIYGYN
ncbi:zinc finger and BTB domain-containing protein 24-like [Dendroctonus ponderosae]|uniref:zinc finger and BTB domain-containing protein 24-like n=1 Tax=Dendroctonus ponderosae TaxID=77166 RepID=UPI002034E329|nr:zinc finger and BTB domain-containing protein 24-like [Dendroctonus ponderosae]KAH1025371.1 hypothetical protein HUJ05_010107 [Dendroctonus ponderosae]